LGLVWFWFYFGTKTDTRSYYYAVGVVTNGNQNNARNTSEIHTWDKNSRLNKHRNKHFKIACTRNSAIGETGEIAQVGGYYAVQFKVIQGH